MTVQHKTLADAKWFTYSLTEQLGNIGSEVGRARIWKEKNPDRFENAMYRAFELMALTINDSRWTSQLSELCRAKECLCDAYTGGNTYMCSLEDMEKYFNQFAIASRLGMMHGRTGE